jgi:dolichol-phosphate mannosyltransferase
VTPPDLSAVVPVYDERDNLDPLMDELGGVLADTGRTWEIVLVDDGSRDGSWERIASLARPGSGIRGLRFRRNAGQTAAFDAGFKAARGRIVITLDADRQNDPADIPRLLAALEQPPGYDAAVGYRVGRRDTWLRRISSRIANAVRNRLSQDDIVDTGCSLKAFRREALAGLKLYTGLHRFLPTLLRMEGFRVIQVPVGHRPRVAGASKYGVWNRVFRAFADLLVVRWMRRRGLRYEIDRREP